MNTPVLELRDVRKVYGRTTAVDGVSLSVAKGEFVSLLGPSGSGKTTTLQLIAGLIAPTGGSILFAGRDIGPLPPHKRNIGVVFQSYALFPHLTVARNIAFPLEMRGIAKPDIARRVADALQLVDLPGLGDRLPGQLSGGQQQRVALARAIVFEPELLLMDEPLGALDRKLRDQMQIEIRQLHKRLGVTILYVTHDQDEALIMSDRIAVFNSGRIEQIASPAELYERPRTRFVAEFVGESNVLAATVVARDKGHCTLAIGESWLRAATCAPPTCGTQVMLSIRPERISMTAGTPGGTHASNEVAAVVSEIIYMGRQRRYVLQSTDGALRMSVLMLVGGAESQVFAIGDHVTIGWAVSDCVLLEAAHDQGSQ